VNLFDDRFVGFVDILGFSDLVKRMHHHGDEELFGTVRDALATIDAQAQNLEEYRQLCNQPQHSHRVSLLPATDVTMTAFSDCYLISEKASDGEGEISPWHVMAAVQALGSNLLAKNILTRGAVVRGNAYHCGRVAFGPAIIDAYNIERNVAKYPRILVSDEVRSAISWEDGTMWGGHLLLQDIDGCSFVNVLAPSLSKWNTVLNDTSTLATKDFLIRVRGLLLQRLKSTAEASAGFETKLRLASKVKWLIYHFNTAAEASGVAPIDG
jgi:hypothetical protein